MADVGYQIINHIVMALIERSLRAKFVHSNTMVGKPYCKSSDRNNYIGINKGRVAF